VKQPMTEAGKRYVYGSLRDMIERYGPGWSLHTVIVDIEQEAAQLAVNTARTDPETGSNDQPEGPDRA
jgi:hypothetical protein